MGATTRGRHISGTHSLVMTTATVTDDSNFSDFVLTYERALRDSPQSDWYEASITVLDGVFRLAFKKGLAESGVKVVTREHWYTRLAAALTVYITSSDTRITIDQLSAICRRKQVVAYIFNASGYRNMRHVLPLIGRQIGDDVQVPVERLPVFFAFVGLDDINDDLMSLALQQSPDVLLTLMLGWLNQRAVLTEQGEKNRGLLLQSGSLVETAKLSDSHIEQVVNAWMYCSYASTSRKHSVKKSLNRLMSDLMSDAGITVSEPAIETRSKPRVVVIHERFIEQHAMYRCYAPSISALKEKFELIAIADEEWIDEASDHIFDEVIRIEDKIKNIASLARLVQKLKPNLVYYPSLGMTHWTVMLAQLRLAPIQIMSHGHPGTSMSPVIDYAYVCELEGDLAAIHSERLLVGSRYATFAPHSGLPKKLPPLISPSDREVRVAVNSKVMKLSHRLLQICRRLVDESTVPVRFSFFPGERGLFYDGLVPAIKAQLPGANVEPYIDYDTFLRAMCKCDVALAAFPFGNTNSTVDTCLLGLPTVAHFGPESPAQSDKLVLTTAGFPEWLIAATDDEYFDKAFRLINEPTFRTRLMSEVDRKIVRKNFCQY